VIDPVPDRHGYIHRLGPTPLVGVQLASGAPVIHCKLEFLNPSGSTKDRIARFILGKAWRLEQLGPLSIVVEASSGSTSIAMALACAQLGIRFVAVMPEGVSNERVLIIRAYGGDIRLTPAAEGIGGAIAETEAMAERDPAVFLPRQFSNPDNVNAHRIGTAREIIEQIPGGVVDAVVSGVGTGGTLVGLFAGLREAGCPVTPFLALPVNLTGPAEAECCSFSARIPGVVDSMSKLFDRASMAGLEMVEVRDEDALATARELIRRGFPVGPSSGLNYRAALEVAKQLPEGARIVTVLPDRMERYFSTDLFRPLTEL